MANDWVPHVVQQGEHVQKLAFRAGTTADEVWAHGKNQDLAGRRQNMDTLCPGDVIHLPAEPGAGNDLVAGTSNRYRAKVPTVPLKVKLGSTQRPLGSQPFEVHGLGSAEPVTGTTGAEGEVEIDVPIWVREVEIHLPESGVRVAVRMGDLDPIEEPSGVEQRLRNLGYLPERGELREGSLESAIRAFERDEGRAETGEVGDETRRALKRRHGT